MAVRPNGLTIADHTYGVVWASGLLMSPLWAECPMVAVGLWYGQVEAMDNKHNLNAQRYRDEVRRHHLMFQHDNARPHVKTICSQFLEKLKTSQFFHGLHTHKTCHPLSMFGMLWIDMFDSVFQFQPISSNFAQPLKRSGRKFHQPHSTAWSALCEGDVWWSRQILIGFLIHYFFLRYLWPTDVYLYSQSCEIHRLGPYECISIDWFSYMNCK